MTWTSIHICIIVAVKDIEIIIDYILYIILYILLIFSIII